MNAKQKFWFWVLLLYGLLILLAVFLSTKSTDIFGFEWNWGLAIFLGVIIYTVASFDDVGPTELGVRIFFGRPLDNVKSGFVFLPAAPERILSLRKETCEIIQNEFPGEPENVFRGDGDVPPGKVPPIRIPFGKPDPQDGGGALDQDPLSLRLTEEVVIVVRWRIKDYAKFLPVMITTDNAAKQLEDLCVATLSREFGQVTIDRVIANYMKYNDTLTTDIQIATTTWGIELESARVKVINLSHDLNRAIQSIAENTARGKSEVIKAEAAKQAAIRDGEGKGIAAKNILTGRTDGLQDMAARLKVSGSGVLAAETARGITENPGQKTFIAGSGGFRDIVVAANVLGETLQGGKSPIILPSQEEKS